MVPDLTAYDWIVINSSAGKDSQAMTDVVVTLARAAGVADRLVFVHCDLGRVEWEGTRALAEEHAAHYGLRCEVVSRPQGDLLTHVEQRGKWPSSTARYCTSDHKRGQVDKLFTRLTWEAHRDGTANYFDAPVRILNCMGIRAQESPARAKRTPFVAHDTRASNGRRRVSQWLPIFDWTLEQVWARNAEAGTRVHPAYALGMPRLSCCFCIFAPKAALVLAGQHNRQLLADYVAVEQRIGHTFRIDLTLADVAATVDAGCTSDPVTDWSM
jgi:3'-phosphoadenosine 5'-phosphosulfate sulfotransferase (PAPS reductase)/FAD synthetase